MYAIRSLFSWGMERVRRFTLIDVVAFKLCLVSVGTLIGLNCAKLCRRVAPVIWVVAAVSWIYLVWRMVLRED